MILWANEAIKKFQPTHTCLSLGAVSYSTRLIAIYYQPVYIFLNTGYPLYFGMMLSHLFIMNH